MGGLRLDGGGLQVGEEGGEGSRLRVQVCFQFLEQEVEWV